MSLDPGDSTTAVWDKWEGHVINGVFPLRRFLGSSDHSGVFLTQSAARGPAEVAIKLVPTNRSQAEVMLPRWRRVGSLTHPHLLQLWEWGGCQLNGAPHLYVVMEYADQTLAQLLLHRALSDVEAREMLPPILEALSFLHGRNLVQGQLKPANILVVGDALKLASDTIRPFGAGGTLAPSIFDPPEAAAGDCSAAADIWALGVSLVEALTGRALPDLGPSGQAVVLPPEFPPEFRDTVARCLSVNPQARPSPTELLAWANGSSALPSAPEPVPAPAPPVATRIPPAALRPAPTRVDSSKPRVWPRVMLAAAVVVVLGWIGRRAFRADRPPTPPPPPIHAAGGSRPETARVTAATAAPSRAPDALASQSQVGTPPSALHEEIPDVPLSARRTIHGHIKVWVRVIVEQDGSVSAADVDLPGSSRYFRRLAIEASKKWMFPAVDAAPTRLMQVRFDFSRDGTTGHAVALH